MHSGFNRNEIVFQPRLSQAKILDIGLGNPGSVECSYQGVNQLGWNPLAISDETTLLCFDDDLCILWRAEPAPSGVNLDPSNAFLGLS